MNSITVLSFLACLGVCLAVNCPLDKPKQKTEYNPFNNFWRLNFWANNGATAGAQQEKDALRDSCDSVWMKKGSCYVLKPDEAGDFIMLCADTMFADSITFKYRQSGAWFEDVVTINDASELTTTCYNRFEPTIADVDRLRICFPDVTQVVKLKNVYASMCAPP